MPLIVFHSSSSLFKVELLCSSLFKVESHHTADHCFADIWKSLVFRRSEYAERMTVVKH